MCFTIECLVLNFRTEQGKQIFLDENYMKLVIGAFAVMRLSQNLKSGSHIYMDCYFTTIASQESLHDEELYKTGTIIKSKIPFSAHHNRKRNEENLEGLF